MEKQFFTQLSELMNEDTDLNLKISKSGNNLIIALHPKPNSKDAINSIPPLNIKGTATELDNDFIATIKQPLEKATGVIANIQWHDKAMASIEAKKKEELANKNGKKTSVKKVASISTPIVNTLEKEVEVQGESQEKGGELDLFA